MPTFSNPYIQVIVVEYVWMSIAIIFYVLAGFASPLALNRILLYAYIMFLYADTNFN